jgi:hypothetical protein
MAFTNPAGDELCILAAEIKDQYFLMVRHWNLLKMFYFPLSP